MSRVRIPSSPRALTWCAVLAATVLAVTGLTQCRQVPETVTGVDITAGSGLGARNECVHRCRRDFREALEKERMRHRNALAECGHDSQCKRDEAERHVKNVQDLVAQRRACKKGCYNEGGGKGGR